MSASTIHPAASRVLVTGATGFIGSALLAALQGRVVRRVLRQPAVDALPGDTVVGDIGPDTDWTGALTGVDCVIHLAARTHVLSESSLNPLAEFRRINVEGTRRLAEQAVAAGVRRFILLSSIKVNGESTGSHPFTERDIPAPEDAYGISKFEAEEALRHAAGSGRMEWTILRPPLVYGAGVRGNFLRLLRAIDRGLPLPLSSINNRRSLIHVRNLCDAVVACIDAAEAQNRVFLVRDGMDISTPDLIRRLADAMGKPARLFPCPPAILLAGARLIGRSAAVKRLTGSLTIDDSSIRMALGWDARIPLDQGLIETAEWYHQTQLQNGS